MWCTFLLFHALTASPSIYMQLSPVRHPLLIYLGCKGAGQGLLAACPYIVHATNSCALPFAYILIATAYLGCGGAGQGLLAACQSIVQPSPARCNLLQLLSNPYPTTYFGCEGAGKGMLAACQSLQQRRGDGHAVGASQGADLVQGVIPSGAARVEV